MGHKPTIEQKLTVARSPQASPKARELETYCLPDIALESSATEPHSGVCKAAFIRRRCPGERSLGLPPRLFEKKGKPRLCGFCAHPPNPKGLIESLCSF
jgi:hypothetical protein